VSEITRPAALGPETRLGRALGAARIDFKPLTPRPRPPALVLAILVAILGSLAADAVLVAAGVAVFPSTKGYVHFHFADYSKLTVIGILIAAAGWPVITAVSSVPRWIYLRLAVLVTLVLWLPDVWILMKGQPAGAVAVLMVMHVAIAVITYNAMVRLAPAGGSARTRHS
jgi:hypothetical protein